jgi:hypothetical protein
VRGQQLVKGLRSDCQTAGHQLTQVVEGDDPVAQQAPPLLGVGGNDVRGAMIRMVRGRAQGLV